MADEKIEPKRRNNSVFNDKDNSLTVTIFLGKPESIPMALGSLELAKELVKGISMDLAMKERATRGIIVPAATNGKDGMHVL